MNDKYMTLFSKTDSQLNKELRRRGFKDEIRKGKTYPLNGKIYDSYCPAVNRERAIAEIIYKDAFDAGRSLKAKEVAEESRYDYYLTDYENHRYKVSLTASQIKLLEWLIFELKYNIDYESVKNFCYEDVGRI